MPRDAGVRGKREPDKRDRTYETGDDRDGYDRPPDARSMPMTPTVPTPAGLLFDGPEFV